MGKMASPLEVAKIVKYIYESPQELNFREVVMHSTKQVA
jgi:NADP-dependent 3-hydroxy acid dehydrogenase YdfG